MEKIEHLEELSKLKFTEKEKKKFKDEFDTVLDFVSEITRINLKNQVGGFILSDIKTDYKVTLIKM